MGAEDGAAARHESFIEEDVMAVDEKFEQLKEPIYKGKKLDDPINTAVVRSTSSSSLFNVQRAFQLNRAIGQVGTSSCIS